MHNREAVRWNIEVSKETDLSLRFFLALQGIKPAGRAQFIEQAVLRQVFQRTVEDIHTRNLDTNPEQLAIEIDTVLREVRAEISAQDPPRRSA